MIRLATVGTGWIVGEFLKGAREAGGIRYMACYSRSQQTGEVFAQTWGAQKVYTDLEKMAADEEIDAVYIASPNRLHYMQSKLFLQHGKHVICEKPITVEPEELQELQELAQQKNLKTHQALIGVYLPQMKILQGAVKRTGGRCIWPGSIFRSTPPNTPPTCAGSCPTSLTRRWRPAAGWIWASTACIRPSCCLACRMMSTPMHAF